MDDVSDELLRQHDVLIASDNLFHQRARPFKSSGASSVGG